jgi:hypothetical protein
MGRKYRQKPLSDAPPASAIAATALRNVTIWISLAFMSRLLDYQPLAADSGFTLVLLPASASSNDTETDLTRVGRLHY